MKTFTKDTLIITSAIVFCLILMAGIIIGVKNQPKIDNRKYLYDYYDHDSIHYIIYERHDTIYHEEYITGRLISRIKTPLK